MPWVQVLPGPPTSIPAALSTYAVPADVPNNPADNVAIESTVKPSFNRKGCPFVAILTVIVLQVSYCS